MAEKGLFHIGTIVTGWNGASKHQVGSAAEYLFDFTCLSANFESYEFPSKKA